MSGTQAGGKGQRSCLDARARRASTRSSRMPRSAPFGSTCRAPFGSKMSFAPSERFLGVLAWAHGELRSLDVSGA